MITLKDLLDNRKAALLNYELNPELQVKFSGDSLRSEDMLFFKEPTLMVVSTVITRLFSEK